MCGDLTIGELLLIGGFIGSLLGVSWFIKTHVLKKKEPIIKA